ncbi:hypothetical protein AVEN_155739-1 [Araneus ventricosus]|uniref:Retrovirus-related Pol polyprotein from transposon TNT 1-94-like beta-barrel domain-containing protein n=1 Tax=Araneus ventricosus TaxID=182803 RepID=A0A4Y2RCT4_ARAVE|nr:hypothetical protein AVEN_155739-1 [Araneus ventricosus]
MFDAPRPLRLGDGRFMYAKSIGDVQVEMLVKENDSLTNVWYVPESGQYLFSSGSVLDKGLIEFADNKQREFENKNCDTVAVVIRYNHVYKLLMCVLVPESSCIAVKNDLLQLWFDKFLTCLDHLEKLEEDILYRRTVGSLMYLALVSIPDIAYLVGVISRVLEKTSKVLWCLVKKVLKC